MVTTSWKTSGKPLNTLKVFKPKRIRLDPSTGSAPPVLMMAGQKGNNMEFIRVYDLLQVIEGDDRVCIDLPGKSSGVGFVHDFRRDLSDEFLNARVTCVWRSQYSKIVIEAEVI